MIVLKKIPNKKDINDTTSINIESKSILLSDVLEDIKHFLMACGYQIDPSSKLIVFKEEE